MTLTEYGIVGAVCAATTIHESYLFEDETFCKLLKQFADSLTIDDAIDRLTVYINENY